MSTSLNEIANMPASNVSDALALLVVETLSADTRVADIEYVGRDENGRALLRVSAVDGRDGALEGTFSVGRVINSLSETHSAHQARLEKARRDLEKAGEAYERAREAREKRLWENARILQKVGVRIVDIVRISNKLARGTYITAEERRMWADYERLVVRDGDRPLKVALHLPNVISHI